MMKAFSVALGLALALGTTAVLANDDHDDKVPAAEVEKIKAVLSELGCSGYKGLKKGEEGISEIDDAKCKMGTMDIKLDKEIKVLLISCY